MTSKTHWVEPLACAAALSDEENLVLLHSGTCAGKRSFLAWGLADTITNLDELKAASGKWFGWIGYGARLQLENLGQGAATHIPLDEVFFAQFENVVMFDHEARTVSAVGVKAGEVPAFAGVAETVVKSSMTDDEYVQKVQRIKDEIAAGGLYQANLTRKFFGEFDEAPDAFALFCALSEKSPAPYSAFMKFGNKAVISSSPEKMLSVADGVAITSPIKGTMPASVAASVLAESEKDKAENLMIVDLMRNDLSKTCDDVQTPELFEITSYPAYHHMHSTVTGKLRGSAMETVLGCFPPGSMTGAPKIAAMELCNELEGVERGLYSGALGWFDDDECDFSVVIRTLILDGKKFEFQAGGGITNGSEPASELAEMYTKASPIMELLGINPEALT